ncbi:MAG TPA: hypothetical protein VIF62_22650 [Labilithrix sp.]|jgi:hypothetical protein
MKRSVLAAVAASCVMWSAVSRADDPKPGEGSRDHVASDRAVRFGPAVSAGLPDGARVDLRMRWRRLITIGAGGAWLPQTSVPGASASIERIAAEGYLRVHPFRGRFFLGVAGGWTRIEGQTTSQASTHGSALDVEGKGRASDAYVAPHLGVVWSFPLGITAGMDVGVQIPVASSGPTFSAEADGHTRTVTSTSPAAQAMRLATTRPIPVFHLLELGVML